MIANAQIPVEGDFPSGAVTGRLRFGLERQAVRLVKDGSEGRDAWTVCLIQVRDQRDAAAFSRLFAHFAPRVKAYLVRCGAMPSQAEDLMQEAMAVVWHKAALFRPERASASTWVFTIARNKQLDAFRRRNRPEPEEVDWGPDEVEDPAVSVATSQEEERVRKAVLKLPERQRQMIEQAFFGDLSHREIAASTGLPLGTIKSRIRLGLERLRQELSEDLIQ